MSIIGWIILGAIAGWIAKAVTGVGEKQGCIFNIVIGIIGSVVGGFIFSYLGGTGVTGFNLYSLAVAAVGAVVFLAIASLFRGKE
ncbi:MAG: GlsB/YeaQ/YmgE family stress response membrane protein [Ectothiorhodospiraceae bacterium]|nr:GlsB/YeaQ/YmgE family stress response membrane protein [Ectothiorhodospiraceae bacterium]